MHKTLIGINCRFLIIILVLLATVPLFAQANRENIALGSTVTFSRAPNYHYSTDPDDIHQLTDGAFSTGWMDKAMVGWVRHLRVSITLDLGQVQPIGGISFSTAAGSGGVEWPLAIQMFCSDDAKDWYFAGDLLKMSAAPPPSGYRAFRYATGALQTHGRYLRLTVTASGILIFCDEIEVYRGDATLLAAARGPVHTAEMLDRLTLGVGYQRRLELDKAAATNAVRESTLPEGQQQQWLARLDKDFQQAVNMPPDPLTFKAILPYNDAHARILALNSLTMQRRKLPAFFAWKKHRFDPLTPYETPEKLEKPKMAIEMLKGEQRADAFLLTNTTDQPIDALIVLRGMKGGKNSDWLRVSSVPWVDTAQLIPVAAALPDIPYTGGYRIDIPAGMTRKIWFTVDSSRLSPGRDTGEIRVTSNTATLRIPFAVRVSKVAMQLPRLSLGMWDYTDRDNYIGINLENRDAAIALMRSHGVDSPWATRNVLPWPDTADFSAANALQTPLAFARFDAWIKRWPGARQYIIYCNVGETFAGAIMGTPDFNARVGAWTAALSRHMTELGLPPRQLWLSLVDEPKTDEKNALYTAWARPILAAAPELTLFVNPAWKQPEQAKEQAMFDVADVLCPNIPLFLTGTDEARSFFEQRQRAGKTLWFYSSLGPVRHFDPHRYYRLLAWYAFRHRASGIGFWAFGDNGSWRNSWVDFMNDRYNYSPVYLDQTSVTDSIHWQAVREGIEDFETLAMLRDAAERTPKPELRQQAMKLLATVDAVLGDQATQLKLTWDNANDRTRPDAIRTHAISLLEKMQ